MSLWSLDGGFWWSLGSTFWMPFFKLFYILNSFESTEPVTPFWCQQNGANITYAPTSCWAFEREDNSIAYTPFTWGFQRVTNKNYQGENSKAAWWQGPSDIWHIHTHVYFSQKFRPRTKLICISTLTPPPISQMISREVTFPFFVS